MERGIFEIADTENPVPEELPVRKIDAAVDFGKVYEMVSRGRAQKCHSTQGEIKRRATGQHGRLPQRSQRIILCQRTIRERSE